MSSGLPLLPLEPLVAGMMVFSRLTGLFLAMPGTSTIPAIARMGIALPLTLILLPAVEHLSLPPTLPLLLGGLFMETLTGLAMGMVVMVLVGALTVAGEMISISIGLSMAQLLDPLTHSRNDTIGVFCNMLAMGMLVITDTHLRCLTVLASSLQTLPPGQLLMPNAAIPLLIEATATTLRVGVSLAGPVVAFAFLTHLAISVLGRMAPNLNIFFSIGLSLNVLAGLVVFMISIPTFLYAFSPMLNLAVTRAAEIVGVVF